MQRSLRSGIEVPLSLREILEEMTSALDSSDSVGEGEGNAFSSSSSSSSSSSESDAENLMDEAEDLTDEAKDLIDSIVEEKKE